MKKKLFLSILLSLSGFFTLDVFASEIIVLENDVIKKEISAPKTPSPVKIKSFTANHTSLIHDDPVAWFEFSVNNEILKATDPIWVFDELQTREMLNGGMEYFLSYECTKESFRGMKVHIYQQLFPNSTLIREKLKITNSGENTIKLTKVNGELHFHFPAYNIPFTSPEVEEIRIATWSKDPLPFDEKKTYDDRHFDGDPHISLSKSWMFHPNVIYHSLDHEPLVTKGPISIINNSNGKGWITTYEHASQDTRSGIRDFEMTLSREGFAIENQQDVGDEIHFTKTDEHMHFIGVDHRKKNDYTRVSVKLLRGGYLDEEPITPEMPYSTVWMASAWYENQQPLKIVKEYLRNQITEYDASRKPEFYYNTWGMQREYGDRGKSVRGIFTEERILQEIEYAAQMNVDRFVLDDGWQQYFGEWVPHKDRLPNGLGPIKKALDKHDIKLGVWMNPSIVDPDAPLYQNHQEWVVRDAEGDILTAQHGNPALDMVGPYYYRILEECKQLIDQGVRFFKLDAINEYNSYLPGLWHGDESYSIKERIARYDYLLPVVVNRLMEELVKYEPEVVIEMDVTEARRSMIGLAPLSYGKFFWMNNGASWYGDYSHYRTKSMRTIANLYEPYIPLDLFTYANYPHNAYPFYAQRYNVNTSLIAGNGFWGNLDLLNNEQRLRVGKQVAKSKKVLPYLGGDYTTIIGQIGSSPEIYTQFNPDIGAGQVIAFSSEITAYEHIIKLKDSPVLGVLNHSYTIENDTLYLPFEFNMPDDTREAFILPSENSSEVRIVSSTCWLDDIYIDHNGLSYVSGATGKQIIYWNSGMGKPRIANTIEHSVSKNNDYYIIKIHSSPDEKIMINQNS